MNEHEFISDTFSFKTKLVKEILNEGVYNTKLSADKVKFVEEYMLAHNPLITQLNLEALWVQPNDTFKHNNFYFNGELNGKKQFCSLLAIGQCRKSPVKGEIDRTKNAMRSAVAKDVLDIKKYLLTEVKQTACAICGTAFAPMSNDQIHMHHTGKFQFRHLVDLFLTTDNNLVVADKTDFGGTWELVDNQSKQDWVAFHNSAATLEMVCATCNLTESKS